jgi:UDP-N-acetylglucosamine--dolichyl-phosphate N-acetylglucosaminephosphotransferase
MLVLFISGLVALATTLILTPHITKFLQLVGIVSIDVHKKNKPRLPASGGIYIAAGVLAGIFVYAGIQTFVYGNFVQSSHLLIAATSIVVVTFIGVLDDLNVKSQPVPTRDGKNIKIGLPQWLKPLLVLPAALPLMVINVGETTLGIPIIGDVDFGILYPLLIIPLGVLGASNMVNMLGGFNGVEAGMGLVYTFALGTHALGQGSELAALIFFSAFAALIPFIKYNWYPARILPGDSLTYLLGVIVAAGVIIGNMERVGIIVMTPFIIQGLLKFYSKFKLGEFASDLGILQNSGVVKPKYNRIYSLTHIVMRIGDFKENQIALILIFVQIFFAILPFVI